MSDLKDLINKIATAAEAAATVLPAAGIAGGVARIGTKLLDIVEDLHHHAPDNESKEQLEAAHDALVEAVSTKSSDLSRRLRG